MNRSFLAPFRRPPLRTATCLRLFATSALRRMQGYSEVSYMPEESNATPQFAFSSIQNHVSALKTMLKNNPSDLDKNNARRSLCAIAKQINAVPSESLKYEPIQPKNVSLILHGIYHTASLPNPTVGSKPAVDLSPIFSYLENIFWSTKCATWSASDIGEILKVCAKISSVPIVSVLAGLIQPCIRLIPKLRPNELVLVARSFHAVGIQHPFLHEGIMKEAKALTDKLSADDLNRILMTMLDAKVAEGDRANIATLFEALMAKATGGVKSLNAPIVSRCLRVLIVCSRNYPLMFAELKPKVEAFQGILYTRSMETISCAPVPDVVEICANFAVLLEKDRFEKLFQLTAERVTALAQSLKPKHIAMLFHASAQQHVLDENLLNVLAERSCGQMANFDECEIADVVESLASFDLYDAELFTMVATRFAQKTRERELLDPFAITRVLQAFAKLKEKNDALLFSCAQQYSLNLYSLERVTMERALAVFKQFDFNHRDIMAQLESRLEGMGSA